MKERWKQFRNSIYEVSNLGIIRQIEATDRSPAGYIVSQSLRNKQGGYLSCSLLLKGRRRTVYIHQIVAEVFLGPCPPGKEVNHKGKNGDKTNNRSSNLEYLTRSENNKHAFVNGLHTVPRGEAFWGAKLTFEKVLKIRRLYRTGNYSHRELGSVFGVSSRWIGYIVQGKCWPMRNTNV